MKKYEWIGLREKDNFSYIKGENPIYDTNCHNSLIISNLEEGVIKGVSNHALIKNSGKNYLIPITKINEIIDLSKEILNESKVFYKKPKSIFEMQNLKDLSEDYIKQKLVENYNLEIKNLLEIKTKKGKNRTYKIISKKNKEFMLKYQGKNSELFEYQSSFLEGISFFPKIISTINSLRYISINNSIYALEEFVEGNKFPLDMENYFNLVGKHLALMHNEFNQKNILKNNLEIVLAQEGNSLSESNLNSMQIDLKINSNNEFFLKEIDSFPKSLGQIVNSFPNQIIHGDLNKSNLIWNENNATIIDSETIRFSQRIKDFIPASLFEGNLNIPSYTPNSLKKLIESYDFYSNQKLSEAEKTILPNLLKFSLIKSYVIYVLRRNLKDEKFKNKIIHNLKLIGGEINVH
ncbi:hypothetical protein KAI04_04515 [Candidatus Pacearchaeota archaeon]|nr:hypothetical protein [Candidatus Pacearchaeota archaeon]